MDQDLEALRRRAFSRDGTEEDLRELARIRDAVTREPDAPAPERPLAAVIQPESGRIDDGDDVDAAPIPHPPRRRGRVVAAAALGLVAGIVLGAVGARLTAPPPPDPNDSLRVFDLPAVQPPEGVELPPRLLDGPATEVRYLGEVEGTHVFASRTVGSLQGLVCLGLVAPPIAGAGCTTLEEFRRSGVWMYQGDLGVGWGPRGEELWTPPPLDVD